MKWLVKSPEVQYPLLFVQDLLFKKKKKTIGRILKKHVKSIGDTTELYDFWRTMNLWKTVTLITWRPDTEECQRVKSGSGKLVIHPSINLFCHFSTSTYLSQLGAVQFVGVSIVPGTRCFFITNSFGLELRMWRQQIAGDWLASKQCHQRRDERLLKSATFFNKLNLWW